MCGIAGFLDPERGADPARAQLLLETMAATLVHRGPDAGGTWADPDSGAGLAHRRLAIVDLSAAGEQPMASSSGRYRIVFNGEIYNFLELGEELSRRGASFRGHSDTEVLLECIETFGLADTLRRVSGMFAFALWDGRERILHLARDRLGEKPLYYGRLGSSLVFASELRALRVHPGWRGGVERGALVQLLRYGYVPAPLSIHPGIYKLPPGTCLSVPLRDMPGLRLEPEAGLSMPGVARPQAYWSAREAAERGFADLWQDTDTAAVDGLEHLLRQVVRQQMVADVPLGGFLSGGIDSSTVVALMQAQSARPIRTFTIGFDEADYDEAKYAKAVARHLGTDHAELYVRPEQALEVIPGLPELYDEPFADPSQIPAYLVSRLAREHVTVALSGDGGDELFAGYNRYLWAERIWRQGRHLPRPLKNAAAAALTAVPAAGWDRLFSGLRQRLPRLGVLRQANLGGKLHKLAYALRAQEPTALYRWLMSYWADPLLVVPDGVEPGDPMASDNMLHGRRLVDTFMYWDQVAYLPGDNLVKMDRASMAVSLETRLPLLDHRIVEFAWRIPSSLKVRDGQSKWLLRQLLYRYVPATLVDRPKMGFSVPIGGWLRGPLREWGEDLLAESRLRQDGLLDAAAVRACWDAHQAGEDRSLPLWAILMFQSWYFGQRAESPAFMAEVA